MKLHRSHLLLIAIVISFPLSRVANAGSMPGVTPLSEELQNRYRYLQPEEKCDPENGETEILLGGKRACHWQIVVKDKEN